MMFELEPERKAWGKTTPAVTAKNMQQVADNDRMLQFYNSLDPAQQESFKSALADEKTWTPAEFLKSVTARVSNLPKAETPYPESIMPYNKDVGGFKGWLRRQALLIDDNPNGLAFVLGEAYELESSGNQARTISVPIHITRNKMKCAETEFVFHYHPGVGGPSVGQANASSGHFKPYDRAQKFIRMTQDDMNNNERMKTLFRDAKQDARDFDRRRRAAAG
jgi:hypothetical protein